MKPLLFVTMIVSLIILSQCNRVANKVIDPEKEKLQIQKLLNDNYDQLVKADKKDFVAFARKYSLAKGYLMANDSLIFVNIADTSDDRIYLSAFPGSIRYNSFKPLYTPIIKIMPDGKTAYSFSKDLVTYSYDSLGKKITRKFMMTCLQIFEKSDSIWKTGDYMMSTKSPGAK